ncbi:MAG: DUF6273 domain-containing protein [Bacilli bacterium]|nr:DUF6273 domain-containing protein [Bacilli bacterium]
MKLSTELATIFSFFALLLASCNVQGSSSSDGTENYQSNTIVDDSVSSTAEQLFTIIWKDWNGDVLEIDNDVKRGVTPTYDGATPTRADGSECIYLWTGWDPAVHRAYSNEIYTATYYCATYHVLSVTSEDTTKGNVAVTSGRGYSEEHITVVATPADDYVFRGWYHDEKKVSSNKTYTFRMPPNDYSLVARFITEEESRRLGFIPTVSEDGKTLTYGLYPQNKVNDWLLVSSLNQLTTPESNGWYLYGNDYYAKVMATPHNSDYEFDNGTTIVRGTTYWFKCEPITWNILSSNGGDFYLVSSVLLDTHCYYKNTTIRTIDGKTVYTNNYKHSDIRAWLNNNFYNSAFALDDSFIQTATVDNSASTTNSTNNSYACNNTQDKVLLPSYKDYIKPYYGFLTSIGETSTRSCRTTDWSRARGAFYHTGSDKYQYNGFYWTRSPYSGYSNYVSGVKGDGSLDNLYYVCDANYSVRPSLWIHIA